MNTIKVVPKKNFLLRVEKVKKGGESKLVRIIAKKGEKIDVTTEESERFSHLFTFLNADDAPAKKKGLTVK
jgi:hypothetical protein